MEILLYLDVLALTGHKHRSLFTSNFLTVLSQQHNGPAVQGISWTSTAGVQAQLIYAWRGTLCGLSFLYIDLEIFLEPPRTSRKDDRHKAARQRGNIMSKTGWTQLNAFYTPFNLWNSLPTRCWHKSLWWEFITHTAVSQYTRVE